LGPFIHRLIYFALEMADSAVMDISGLDLSSGQNTVSQGFGGTAEVDAFNMVVSCHDAQFAGNQSAEQLKDRATALGQVLAQHLFALPVERSEGGALAHLDNHTTLVPSGPNVTLSLFPLPREKPVRHFPLI